MTSPTRKVTRKPPCNNVLRYRAELLRSYMTSGGNGSSSIGLLSLKDTSVK